VAILADGKIVIRGDVQRAVVGDDDFGVVRPNPDGGLDRSFGTDGRRVVASDLGGATVMRKMPSPPGRAAKLPRRAGRRPVKRPPPAARSTGRADGRSESTPRRRPRRPRGDPDS